MTVLHDQSAYLKKYIQVAEIVFGNPNKPRLTFRELEFFASYVTHYKGESRKNETRRAVNKDLGFTGKDFYVWRSALVKRGWIQSKEEAYAPVQPFNFNGVIPISFTVNESFRLS